MGGRDEKRNCYASFPPFLLMRMQIEIEIRFGLTYCVMHQYGTADTVIVLKSFRVPHVILFPLLHFYLKMYREEYISRKSISLLSTLFMYILYKQLLRSDLKPQTNPIFKSSSEERWFVNKLHEFSKSMP